jgi:hypothetical protein
MKETPLKKRSGFAPLFVLLVSALLVPTLFAAREKARAEAFWGTAPPPGACARIEITCGGKLFRYTDEYIEPTDHTVAEELYNRRINAPLDEKLRTVERCLNAGADFSFNKTVGARTDINGFKEAKIIFKGEYVEGVGGGVCQASTTVYNAALKADMFVTHAQNHSLTSAYVQPSFDAMVSGASDLRFRNTGKTPVFIRAFCTYDAAIVEIYGSALPYRIALESVTLCRAEPPPEREVLDTERKHVPACSRAGDKTRVSYSHGAVKSEGYILYYSRSGKLLERKLLRRDTYNSVQGVIAVTPDEGEGAAAATASKK